MDMDTSLDMPNLASGLVGLVGYADSEYEPQGPIDSLPILRRFLIGPILEVVGEGFSSLEPNVQAELNELVPGEDGSFARMPGEIIEVLAKAGHCLPPELVQSLIKASIITNNV